MSAPTTPGSSARPGTWRSSWDGPASPSSRWPSSRPAYKTERPRTRFRSFFVSDTSDAAARLYVISGNTAVSSSDPNFTGSFGKADRVETVPTITMNDLLDKERVTAIDFLNVDIELHEPMALKGFDVRRYKPALVCIEALLPVRQQILDYFARHGYVVVGNICAPIRKTSISRLSAADVGADAGEPVSWRSLVPGAVVVAAVLGLAVLLPLTPDTFQNAWALSRDGEAFATLPAVGPTDTGIALDLYLRLMQACLATAWVAWMVLAALAQRDAAPRARTMWALAGLGVALTVAAVPPMLSGDALAYVAYGRIPGLHGLNPYLEGGQALAARGDPSARFLVWDTPLPYGPLWALVAAAVAKLGLGLHAELLVHKAWAGLSLLGAAAAAGRLAAFRGAPLGSWAPLVIALNPLLLVEGPGSGHNDIVMVALLLWAAVKSARHHAVGAAIVVGLAVAIKPVALLAVPLVVAAHARPSAGMSTALRVITLLALTLMPTLVLSLPFGGPAVLGARDCQSRRRRPHPDAADDCRAR